jgi:hypothetical protein
VASAPLAPERYVHNLEHGGIVLLYRCDVDAGEDCSSARNTLATVAQNAPDAPTGGHRLLVTAATDLGNFPDGGLPSIAAIAWGWVYLTDQPDQGNIDCFATAHEGQGPEDISSGPPEGCPSP